MWLKDRTCVQCEYSAINLGTAVDGAAGQDIGLRGYARVIRVLDRKRADHATGKTVSVPPLPTDTPLAAPPEDTFIVPPPFTEVPCPCRRKTP